MIIVNSEITKAKNLIILSEQVDCEVKQVSEYEKLDSSDVYDIVGSIGKIKEKTAEEIEAERLEKTAEKIKAKKCAKIEAEKAEKLAKIEAERLAKIEEKKIKKFYEKKEKKAVETQQNLNFIKKIFENKNLIKLNCFEINENTHFKIFIDDKLNKAVEIYPSRKVTILHTVRSDNDYFRLDLHSVKISSGFYSKEEIIINNLLSQKQRNVSLAPTLNAHIAEYADEEIRFWIINRHTGISYIEPMGPVGINKLIVMDDTNQPTNNYFNLVYKGGEKFNCSKKSF
tara:strand:+ start:46 stop:900 length:855 start_codon:yes stop_codon:yes gene_type:complete